MKISRFVAPVGTLEAYVDEIVACEEAGFYSAWVGQVFNWDALTSLAVAATRTKTLRLAAGVIPGYAQHPLTLAAAALTVQSAADGRLTLGVGVSHRFVVEGVWGLSFRRPFQYIDEYLTALLPAMSGENVEYRGDQVTARTWRKLDMPGAGSPDVVLAALGPRMLGLAGRLTSGTITWLTGVETVANYIIPTIKAAAERAQRPSSRVVIGMPTCVTTDLTAATQSAVETFGFYGELPSYRAMLDREGARTPAEVMPIGSEDQVYERLQRYSAAGATEYAAAIFGSPDDQVRTRDLLLRFAAEQRGGTEG